MPVSSLGNILLIDDNPKLIKDTLPMYGRSEERRVGKEC